MQRAWMSCANDARMMCVALINSSFLTSFLLCCFLFIRDAQSTTRKLSTMVSFSVPSLLMQAAQSAAHADGVVPPQASSGGINSAQLMQQAQLLQQQQQQQQQKAKAAAAAGGGKKKGPPLRRGKWTPEEEAYANRLIQEFKAGLLPLTDGTTLRTFLSKLLNCDPMRISKKFVGSNCIGKQVFRRRTADLNRLTPEQIQKSRAELSELERRFLERVAQTNRVKSSGVGGAGPPAGAGPAGTDGIKKEDLDSMINPPSPPWLQPPLGYKQGGGAAMAAANLVGGGGNSRAAAAGRALLDGFGSGGRKNGSSMGGMAGMGGMNSPDSAGLLAMAELQRRASQQSLLQSMRGNSAQNFLAAAGSQGSSMAQMARNASGKYPTLRTLCAHKNAPRSHTHFVCSIIQQPHAWQVLEVAIRSTIS